MMGENMKHRSLPGKKSLAFLIFLRQKLNVKARFNQLLLPCWMPECVKKSLEFMWGGVFYAVG